MERGKKTVFHVKTKKGSTVRIDAEQTLLPLLPKEKHLTYLSMLAIMISGSIASWAFVTGTAVGVLVPIKYAVAALAFGCTISLAFYAYKCVVYSRYGTDMSILGRSSWGHRGIYVIVFVAGFLPTYGWGSLPMIMLGKSISTVLTELGMDGIFTYWKFWSIIMMFIGLYITYVGTTAIDFLSRICAPVTLALLIFIAIIIMQNFGLMQSWNAVPVGVSDDPATLTHNYMIAVEICLGVGFSWLVIISAYTKPSLGENSAFTPSVIGMGAVWAICCLAPALTASLTGSDDPVGALYALGGHFVVAWMIMLIIANFHALVCNPYFLSCSLTAMFPKLKWKQAICIQMIYFVAIIFPVFYDSFGQVILFIAMVQAPAACIWGLDYFLKRKINLRHCYARTTEEKKKSAYWYYKGFNMATWLGLIAGSAVGLWLNNPWTGAIRFTAMYDVVGALLPGAASGVLVYYLIFRFVQMPKRTGLLDPHQTVEEYNAEKNNGSMKNAEVA